MSGVHTEECAYCLLRSEKRKEILLSECMEAKEFFTMKPAAERVYFPAGVSDY